MIRNPVPVVLVAVCLGLFLSPAAANDTELTNGGTPKALNGNTSVAMRREYVKMVIGEKWVTVDCRFTFENRGPSRQVRMGFPDEGGDPGENPDATPQTVKGTFATFQSWVNGKPIKTSVIKASEPGSVWHEKRVNFPAHGTLEVRDRYTVEVGSSVAFSPVSARLARYVLHTGASWRGNIGRSEIEVVFQRKSLQSPITAKRMPKIDSRGFPEGIQGFDTRNLYYEGPSTPTVTGKTLRFVRTNWRPTKTDDILLLFDLRQPKTVSAL
ncbi:MAG: DUF4424 family protein [Armatimonadota bacterium]